MDRQPLVAPMLVLIVVLGALGYAYTQFQGNAKEKPEEIAITNSKVSQSAMPSFDLVALDGKPLRSADLYGGDKPIMISFWATWCGPCKMEQPVLGKLHRMYGEEIAFVSISLDDPAKSKDVQLFKDAMACDYPVAIDTNDTAGKFGVSGIPALFFLNADGSEIGRASGYRGDSGIETVFRKAFKLPTPELDYGPRSRK